MEVKDMLYIFMTIVLIIWFISLFIKIIKILKTTTISRSKKIISIVGLILGVLGLYFPLNSALKVDYYSMEMDMGISLLFVLSTYVLIKDSKKG